MSHLPRTPLLILMTAIGLNMSPLVLAHLNDKEATQSYRQSWFALLALNFGPMVSMVKGEMPWDDARVIDYANQLATLTSMDTSRGFAAGSDKGTTRAKPEIWRNKDDFNQKMLDMRNSTQDLKSAAMTTDKKIIAASVAATGKACKACHDDYKSKDYLY